MSYQWHSLPLCERCSCCPQEVENLSNHLSQLKFAASRVSEAREAVIQLDAYRQRQKEGEAPEVLVPLTGALYVKVGMKRRFVTYDSI